MTKKLKGGGGGSMSTVSARFIQQTYAGDNSVLHFMKRIKQKNHE
ncbi:hypothetical protein T03_6185 [Trichinella britovi]|uniref:Uncharacterized protein n=1 Tax=Trichinella britovi TaxID=45882 RepID=A0A0V0Z300_TRIBR|nr:hypothetical protein T03_6185 [Trichinella britovi]KRZ64678.1 hypothetical protein T08_3066 [Trichinella sp. T8]